MDNAWRNYLLHEILSVVAPQPWNLSAYRSTLSNLITREQARGRSIILLDETHESQFSPNMISRFHDRYRRVLQDVASQHGLEVHRVDDVLIGLTPEDRFTDGLHLNQAAHAAIGTKLAGLLREATDGYSEISVRSQ